MQKYSSYFSSMPCLGSNKTVKRCRIRFPKMEIQSIAPKYVRQSIIGLFLCYFQVLWLLKNVPNASCFGKSVNFEPWNGDVTSWWASPNLEHMFVMPRTIAGAKFIFPFQVVYELWHIKYLPEFAFKKHAVLELMVPKQNHVLRLNRQTWHSSKNL